MSCIMCGCGSSDNGYVNTRDSSYALLIPPTCKQGSKSFFISDTTHLPQNQHVKLLYSYSDTLGKNHRP